MCERERCMRQMRNAHSNLVRKPKGKGPLRRPRRKTEDNIRMDLRDIWWENVDWTLLTQDEDQWWVDVKMILKFSVP
jgi:hypothetical protein